MIIAQLIRKSNIAEFILYMWQIEDLIRASGFDLATVNQTVISKFNLPEEKLDEIRIWYQNLITLMTEEGLQERGHMSFLGNLIRELNDLHLRLIMTQGEEKYQNLFQEAKANIEEFKEKSSEIFSSAIEVCFTGLYGYLLLRIQKLEISSETKEAMGSFSNLLAALSARFKEVEEGKREL